MIPEIAIILLFIAVGGGIGFFWVYSYLFNRAKRAYLDIHKRIDQVQQQIDQVQQQVQQQMGQLQQKADQLQQQVQQQVGQVQQQMGQLQQKADQLQQQVQQQVGQVQQQMGQLQQKADQLQQQIGQIQHHLLLEHMGSMAHLARDAGYIDTGSLKKTLEFIHELEMDNLSGKDTAQE